MNNKNMDFCVPFAVVLVLVSALATLVFFPAISQSTTLSGSPIDHSVEIQWIKMMNHSTHRAPNPRPDLMSGQRGLTDWQTMIDEVWGPGRTAAQQTQIFQDFIQTLDYEYALFRNRDVDIAGLADKYLAEVQAGVSKGRFAAIMKRLCRAVQNGHTNFTNVDVYFTTPEPGVPLLIGHRYLEHPYFGACLTTDDEGIFVYDVIENHPLELEIGDRILGYDGRPWAELYQELLDEELPIGGGGWLTSDASFAYGWDTAAGSNWHLFTTIDIEKFGTGEIQHLPTSHMVDPGVDLSRQCTDQINSEIPKPTSPEWATWGILERGDSRIGFIWVDGWTDNVEEFFGLACLDMVNDPDLDGLIIDFRSNVGGNMYLSNEGLSHLFNTTVQTVDFGYRINPYSHWHMSRLNSSNAYAIPGDPTSFFDKPIAVLLGPKTISSGDQVALRMTFHPHVRTFGRQTSCSFDSPVAHVMNQYPEFSARYSKYDAGPANNSTIYYSYLGFPVDEEVWLDPADCRDGKDSVIEAAVDWIVPVVSPVPEAPQNLSRIAGIAPNPSNPRTQIKFQVGQAGPCQLGIYDVAGHLVRSRHWTHLPTGPHTFAWEGKMDSGEAAASGLYMVRLKAPDGMSHSRLTLVR